MMEADPNDNYFIVRMFDAFMYRSHLCLTFEVRLFLSLVLLAIFLSFAIFRVPILLTFIFFSFSLLFFFEECRAVL
jgi:hypothetical protein